MNTLDLLYDHYKESISQMKSIQRERDHFFIVLCVLLSVLFILGADPQSAVSTVQQVAESQWGITAIVSLSVLQTFFWMLLLYYTIRYVQRNTYSERLTKYIHCLEEQISSLACTRFDRESKNYLNEYPIVQDITYWIYTIIFPMLYMTLVAHKLVCEFYTGVSVANIIVALLCLVIVFAYLCFLHKHRFIKLIDLIRKRK